MKKNIIIGSAILVFLDQSSKWLIASYFPELVTQNTGVAFGIHVPQIVLIGFTPLIFAGLIYFLSKNMPPKDDYYFLLPTLYSLVLGGALSNYIDRIRLGYVIDFINIGFWPSFNFADTFLVVGICCLMLKFCYGKRK